MSPFTRTGFAVDLLGRIDAPVTRENVTALVAWQRAEGGHFHNDARYNPLNTTLSRPGDRRVNGVGVRAYRSYESGLAATALTLGNGLYGPVLRALRSGGSAGRVARAVVASPWGTTALIGACLPDARDEVARAWRRRGEHRDGGGHQDGAGQRGGGVGRGGHRVLIDPQELARLADQLDRVEDATRWAQSTVERVGRELRLAGGHAPTAARARHLDALLGQAQVELPLLAAAVGRDAGLVRGIRQRALVADDAAPYASPGRVERLLDALGGKVDGATLARLEVLLLGGLAVDRGRRDHSPIVSRPHRRPGPAHDHGGRQRDHAGRQGREEKVRDVVRVATGQLGYHERGDNLTRYGAWYGLNGQPWCAMFVSWVFARSGHPLPNLQSGKGYAGVRVAAENLRRRGLLRDTPKAGDLYLHRGGTWQSDHTGIVVEVERDGDFWTIEGNKDNRVQRVHHPGDEPSMFGFGRVL
jgi:hypothetical protein